jgi:hypothetical protein
MESGNRSFGLRRSTCHENLDTGGPASSNRGPSNRSESEGAPRVLATGIDTLYWSTACGISEERFAAFRDARERAANGDEVIELADHTLVIESHGAGRYPVLLTCSEFSVQLTDSSQLPTAMVQLRSESLHGAGGPRAAFEGSLEVVESICDRRINTPKASRLDVYADVAGWVLTDVDRRGLVTHAKLHPVLRAGTDEYETIQIGKHPMLTRLYRKDIERLATPGFADHFWDGYAGPVVRIEAQAGSKKLRELGIVTVDDALSCYGNLWRYATEDFCRLHVPGARDREGWKLDERWAMLQALSLGEFPSCEMVPFIKAEREQLRAAQQLLGVFASWSAGEGLFDPDEAWHRLRLRYPGLVAAPGRTFAGEVIRRHVRLPRGLRRRHIG